MYNNDIILHKNSKANNMDTITQKFYNNLYKRILTENLTIKEIKTIFRTAKEYNNKVSIKDFLQQKGLICIKSRFIPLHSISLIKTLYQASFKDNKDGFLCDHEIRAIVESFYKVKFDYANYMKFRHHLKTNY